MKRVLVAILLIGTGQTLSGQYLHYWDNSRRRYVQPARQPAPPPTPQPVEVKKPDPPVVLTAPVKIEAATLVSSTTVPSNRVPGAPKFYRPPIIFHDWPDKCPGLTGAVPVLLNYVPPEIVVIVTEKYKGHLYSIVTNNGQNGKPEYKLKVCKDGMIRYEYANYKGEIMADREQ